MEPAAGICCAAGEAGSCTSCLSSMGYSSWTSHSAIPAVAFLSPGAAVSHCSGLKLWAMVWGFVLPLLIFPSSCQLTHFLNPGGLGPFFSLFLGNLFFRREKIDCGISDIPSCTSICLSPRRGDGTSQHSGPCFLAP